MVKRFARPELGCGTSCGTLSAGRALGRGDGRRAGDGGQRLRVLDVVPFEDVDELGFVGMLKVEAA